VLLFAVGCAPQPMQRLDWSEIQDRGGLVVHDAVVLPEGRTQIPIEFDASGLTEVTVKSSVLDSAHVVRDVDVTVDGRTIAFSLLLGAPDGRASNDPPPLVLRVDPGLYEVDYRNRDGSQVPLRYLHLGPAGSTSGRLETVAGSRFHARIVPPAEAPTRNMQAWMPAPQDVLRAEPVIIETLRRLEQGSQTELLQVGRLEDVPKILQRLGDYGAQFTGFVVDGHRRLLCSFFFDHDGNEGADGWVMVADGGYGYWSIDYDLDTDRCIALRINGYA
jgi:hypothetical protein